MSNEEQGYTEGRTVNLFPIFDTITGTRSGSIIAAHELPIHGFQGKNWFSTTMNQRGIMELIQVELEAPSLSMTPSIVG